MAGFLLYNKKVEQSKKEQKPKFFKIEAMKNNFKALKRGCAAWTEQLVWLLDIELISSGWFIIILLVVVVVVAVVVYFVIIIVIRHLIGTSLEDVV